MPGIGRQSSSLRKSFRANQQPKIRMNSSVMIICILLVFLMMYGWGKDGVKQQALNSDQTEQNILKENEDNKSFRKEKQIYFNNQQPKGQRFEVSHNEKEILMLQKLIEIISLEHTNNPFDLLQSSLHQQSSANVNKAVHLEKQIHSIYEQLVRYPLQAVKYFKLTSPKTKTSNILESIKYIFNPYDPYKGLDSMLQKGDQIWQVESNYPVLTVQSDRELRPHFIQLNSYSLQKEQLYLVGILLTPDNELVAVKLGKFNINPGPNVLQCLPLSCEDRYTMILLKLSKMKIGNLKIYEKLYL